jgi:crossover junction endodeoxyribonuclease RuvC
MGLDVSLTSTGFVILENEKIVENGTITTKENEFTNRFDRYSYILVKIEELISYYRPCLIFIEHYSFSSKGRAIYQLGELGGLIRTTIEEYTKYEEIAPSSVKKFATGKGNTKKEDMKLAVYKKWKVEFNTNDEVDAYVLARMAREKLNTIHK